MTHSSTPYDELPYRSFPIEWTAPERLALASLLHGGPRQRLDEYRVLELGCGDGTNLIPMAYYRRHATFVGIDSAQTRIAVANEKRSSLGLTNITFLAADFGSAGTRLSGHFDYIIVHGVFSWISPESRTALLELCAERLRRGGLLYLNYNARPGWNVRGLIREFLLTQTAGLSTLRARSERAQSLAARMAEELSDGPHPYSKLLASEFRFVADTHLSHAAHEYLSEHNDAFTRREFIDLLSSRGFEYVGDADFNYPSGRLPEELSDVLERLNLAAGTSEATADLVCYRQLHSPILTSCGFRRRPPDTGELSGLFVAARLVEQPDARTGWLFRHPSGFEVSAKTDSMAAALRTLQPRWPEGERVHSLFADVDQVIDDLLMLHRHGLIELRLIDRTHFKENTEPLRLTDTHVTTPYHAIEVSTGPRH
jgi:SAM-dependent methyltransferase